MKPLIRKQKMHRIDIDVHVEVETTIVSNVNTF